MWIYINNLDQVIWLAENLKRAWHLNLYSRTRVKNGKRSTLLSGSSLYTLFLTASAITRLLQPMNHMSGRIISKTGTSVDPFQTASQPRLTCQFCEMSFWFQSHLDRHVLQHTGHKPFVCHLCEKSFTRKSTLRGHMLKEHSNMLCDMWHQILRLLHYYWHRLGMLKWRNETRTQNVYSHNEKWSYSEKYLTLALLNKLRCHF